MKNQTLDRLKGLSQRMQTVITEAAGRDLIPPQKAELASVSAELVGLGDEIPESDTARNAYDQTISALADGDHKTAGAYLGDLARLHKVHLQTREVDEARKQFGRLFDKDDRNERMNPYTSSGASMYEAIRKVYNEGQTLVYEFDVREPATSTDYDVRALASSGGSAIPTDFSSQVAFYARTETPMLDPNIVTILGRRSGAPIILPQLTADPALGGTVTAEAAAITEADATLASVTLNPYKYAAIQIFSAELDEDEIIGFDRLISKSFAREIALDFGAHATTGDNSGKPNGIVTAAGNGGTATKAFGGTATTFYDFGDLVSLYQSTPASARKTGAWMMSNGAVTKVLSFRDDNGNRVVLPGLAGSGSLSLLGKPIHENPAMASVGSASRSVIFGDLQSYTVAEVQPMRVEVSRDYRFSTDQVAIKVVRRLDADLLDTGAVKYLVSANT